MMVSISRMMTVSVGTNVFFHRQTFSPRLLAVSAASPLK
jgi:hypothetical protein